MAAADHRDRRIGRAEQFQRSSTKPGQFPGHPGRRGYLHRHGHRRWRMQFDGDDHFVHQRAAVHYSFAAGAGLHGRYGCFGFYAFRRFGSIRLLFVERAQQLFRQCRRPRSISGNAGGRWGVHG